MKQFLFLFFTFWFLKGFTQEDSIKRNAVFLTFEEFRSNAPSIYPTTIAVEESQNKTKFKYTDSSGELKRMKDNFWGFSDSEYVYIIHNGNYGGLLKLVGFACLLIIL